ncbi:MAG TPA: TlpA disulfide reductase family protein [Ramlibacter sp.]
MNQTLNIGPLALPAVLPLAIVALLVASAAGGWAARRTGAAVEKHLYGMLFAGLLAARIAFVLQYLDAYLATPWRMLDVRDGGWNALAGLAAALVYGAVLAVRSAPLRKPLAAATAGAAAVWFAGVLLLGATKPQTTQLPELSFTSLEGTQVPLAAFRGKPLVVNLWATWCPPCRREMPVLQQAQAQRGDVHFVFLNQGESAERVQNWLRTQPQPLRNVLLDTHGELGVQRGHRALPTTLFFDAQGRLVDTRVGELSPASLAERLERVAGNPG